MRVDTYQTLPDGIFDPATGEILCATLSVNGAAARLGLHSQTVRKLIRSGELRAIRARRRVLVPLEAIDEFLDPAPSQAPPAH